MELAPAEAARKTNRKAAAMDRTGCCQGKCATTGVHPLTLGQRINQLTGKEKNEAQEMLAAVQSAVSMSRGPDEARRAAWLAKARDREERLDVLLKVYGA